MRDSADADDDLGASGNDNRLRRELASVQTRSAIGYDIGRRTDDIVVVIDPVSISFLLLFRLLCLTFALK